MLWNDFENFKVTHTIFTYDFVRDNFQKLFVKTADLVYRGKIEDFLDMSEWTLFQHRTQNPSPLV